MRVLHVRPVLFPGKMAVAHVNPCFPRQGAGATRWRVFSGARRRCDTAGLDLLRAVSGMRIIAGTWRARKLAWPRQRGGGSHTTRPMPDRVKETVFNMLGHRYDTPGRLPGLCVADAFAGGGTMGLEALSRGAARCVFHERDAAARVVLRGNIAALGAGARAVVVASDAWRSAATDPDGDGFDLIMLDPPYRDSDDTSPTGRVRSLLRAIAAFEANRPLVVLHHRAAVRPGAYAGEGWSMTDHRRIGTHGVTMLTR